MTVVDHSYQTDETYTYDANGNRTNTGYTTGTNNRVTSDGTYNYTYDDEGNRISRTKISDSTKIEYTWDTRNRLTDVVFKNAGGTVTQKVQYKYDVFDRRIGKKLDTNGDGAYDSATYWVYDDAGKRDPNTGTPLDDIVLEFTDADGDGSGSPTLSTRYLHGPGIDQVLASETITGNVVNWALSDHQGTVRDIVRYASGTTTIVNHRKFDAFGNLTAESDSSVKFLYSYTGREWDGDAGLYYYRARWYDAKLGRFVLEDPIGFAAGDTNLNRYVGNSPVNGTDPSGLTSKKNKGTGPLPPAGMIGNGFPVTLPKPNQVFVIIASQKTHTFLIVLNSAGQTTYYRGGQGGVNNTTLVVQSGPYGTGAEPYVDTTKYVNLGPSTTSVVTTFDKYVSGMQKNPVPYYIGTSNCNSTVAGFLTSAGITIPASPYPNSGSTKTPAPPPGWASPTK